MRKISSLLLAIALTACPGFSLAGAPAFVPIQGYLTDNEGMAIHGEATVKFSLYTDLSGGAPLFEETQVVSVEGGHFTVYLGLVEALDLVLFRDNDTMFIGFTVGTNQEMTPRIEIGTTPYSGLSQYAEHAETASDAQRLSGHAAADFRLSTDSVSWTDLSDVPSGLDDGDSDVLAGMTCAASYVAKSTGTGWECGPDLVLTEADVDAMTADNGYALDSDLAAVAKSGSYSDLSDVPTDLVSGTGTANYLPKFSGPSSIEASIISENANRIGIGTTNPGSSLDVVGNVHVSNNITADGVIYNQEMWMVGGTNFEGRISKNHYGGWPGVSMTSGPVLHFTFGTTDQSSDFRFFNGQTAQGPDEPINWRLSMIIKESGNVGIGRQDPVRKLHVTEAMRLDPSASPPPNPVNGDLYFDTSGAFCAYVNGWQVVAGAGTCD